jgi:hypothetical protein
MCKPTISAFRPVALAAALGVALSMAAATPGVADPSGDSRHWHDHERDDHDAVRGAVERGEIKPLVQLLELVKGRLPGEIVGVDIERKHGVWLYEFRVIDKSGRLFDVYVDAQSGEIRRTKEK